jgi:hypothetical protein
MAFDFPSSPVTGDKYPAPPIAGQPVYAWDGEKWTTLGGSVPGGVQPSNNNPLMDAVAFPGVATLYARSDHVHPSDTTRAPLASPTLTGTVTAPALVVSGAATLGAVTASSISVSGAANLGAVTGAALQVNGNAAPGKIVSTAKGHRLGALGGTVATGALTRADANILLYDADASNWAGIGADSNGTVWVRTGGVGTPPAAFSIDALQNANFLKTPTAPTPTAGDNSSKLATTAFVKARTPGGGYLPLTGGTMTGNLVVANGDLRSYRSDGTGVIWLGTGSCYLYNVNTHYLMPGGQVYASNGRLYGANDFSAPVYNGRLAFAGDYTHPADATMREPYAGAVLTGASSPLGAIRRYRYMQYCTTAWYTIGYV